MVSLRVPDGRDGLGGVRTSGSKKVTPRTTTVWSGSRSAPWDSSGPWNRSNKGQTGKEESQERGPSGLESFLNSPVSFPPWRVHDTRRPPVRRASRGYLIQSLLGRREPRGRDGGRDGRPCHLSEPDWRQGAPDETEVQRRRTRPESSTAPGTTAESGPLATSPLVHRSSEPVTESTCRPSGLDPNTPQPLREDSPRTREFPGSGNPSRGGMTSKY